MLFLIQIFNYSDIANSRRCRPRCRPIRFTSSNETRGMVNARNVIRETPMQILFEIRKNVIGARLAALRAATPSAPRGYVLLMR